MSDAGDLGLRVERDTPDAEEDMATSAARRERRDLRLFRLCEVLRDHPAGLPWDEAWDRCKDAAPIVPDDLVPIGGKVPRGENNVRWYFIDLAKAGWAMHQDGLTRITRAGRAALQEFPTPQAFMGEASRLYAEWDAWRRPENHTIPGDYAARIIPARPSSVVATDALEPLLRRGLSTGESTFQPGASTWTPANIDALHAALVVGKQLDAERSFAQKLQGQLADVPDEARVLMAEVMALIMGSLVDWYKDTKRARVRQVLMTMDDPVGMSMHVDAAMDHGLFGGGIGFKSGLYQRIGDFLVFLRQWVQLSDEERREALSDCWAMQGRLAQGLLAEGSLQGLVLMVLFPSQLPPVASPTHAKQIVASFANLLQDGTTGNLRQDLSLVTMALQREFEGPVNYYETPVVERWRPRDSQPRAWLIRGSSVSGVNLVPAWLQDGFISLPATHMTPLGKPINRPAVAEMVDAAFSGRPPDYRRQKTDDYDRFLRVMKEEDLVVTTSEGRVHVGTLDEGDPEWVEDTELPARVRRSVTWRTPVGTKWSNLPTPLPARLSASDDIADLTEDIDVLLSLEDDVPVTIDPKPPKPPEPPEPIPPQVAVLAEVPDDLAAALHMPVDWLNRLTQLANRRRQVILYGPPGTGKTYLATKLAEHWTDAGNVTLVQFHPSVAYEDFVAGYRPVKKDGQVVFEIRDGPFMRLAERARDNPGVPHVLIIDEINRANLAKVFGELYFLLEYRDHPIEPLYSEEGGNPFTLPKNVFLIGTMNNADRSIALVDAAMRRRFSFIAMHADEPPVNQVLRRWLAEPREEAGYPDGYPMVAADLLDALNARIPDRDFRIGPSYLMKDWVYQEPGGLEEVWDTELLPLLEEHHAGEDLDVEQKYGLPALRAEVDAGHAAEQAGEE